MAALTCVECGRVIDIAAGWADYGDCPVCLACGAGGIPVGGEQTMTQVDYNRRHALYVCEIRIKDTVREGKVMTPQQIRSLRERLKMTQEEFARKLGVTTRSAVSRLESGRRQPTGTMLRLLEELWGKSGNPRKSC